MIFLEMIILDTNVVSEIMRPRPSEIVIKWLDRQPWASVWTTSITVFEIDFGLKVMPSGKRRDTYTAGFKGILDRMEDRIAPFDTEAAEHTSSLMASRKAHGRARELRDTMIAGIVLSRHATLATRNVRDFDDLSRNLVDPWSA